jgi:hypothetical protein
MRGQRAKRQRTEQRPNPGRKGGGATKDTVEHVRVEPEPDRQRPPTKPRDQRR